MGFTDWLLGTQPKAEERAGTFPVGDISIADPAFAEWLDSQGIALYDGTDTRALALSAVYRCVSIISGTIAGLPLKTYRKSGDLRKDVGSWVSDNPAGPYDISPFSWTELVIGHLAMRGEAFLAHVFNQGGSLIGLLPIHPQAVTKVEWDGPDKRFTIQLDDGQTRTFDSSDMTQIMGITLDGLRGVSPLHVFRTGIATALAGEASASSSFSKGLMLKGLVTPDADMTEADAQTIKKGLDAKMTGTDNAGGIAVINRHLKFAPMQMTAADAQFIESRNFQVEEVFRLFGVPMTLSATSGAVSMFGTGQAEANAGLAKFTLMPYTSRVEEALSQLLPQPQFVEFDYSGLLQGTPAQEIELLLAQMAAGLITKDEARAIRNLPPLPKEEPQAAPPTEQPTDDARPTSRPPKSQEGQPES